MNFPIFDRLFFSLDDFAQSTTAHRTGVQQMNLIVQVFCTNNTEIVSVIINNKSTHNGRSENRGDHMIDMPERRFKPVKLFSLEHEEKKHKLLDCIVRAVIAFYSNSFAFRMFVENSVHIRWPWYI